MKPERLLEPKFLKLRTFVAAGSLALFGVGCGASTKACQPYTVYAKNRWNPQGAMLRLEPNKDSQQVGSAEGNQPIVVDGWTHGVAPYPGNPKPFDSDVWLRTRALRAWVSAAAIRATETDYDPTGHADGGPAAATPPNCEVKR